MKPNAQFNPHHPLHKYPKLEAALSAKLGLTEEMTGVWVDAWSDGRWGHGERRVIVELVKMHRDLKYRSDVTKFLDTPGFTKLKNTVRNARKGQ